MSFDIIILRPTDMTVSDITAVEDALEIGAHDSVTAILESMFPGSTDGTFSKGALYSLDVSLSGDPVTSIHLSMRYGAGWIESVSNEFLEALSQVCERLEAVAFAVSDNSRIAPPQ